MESMKYLCLLLVVFSTSICHAQETKYVRDYTYKASDLDSKVSARNNTLKLIKAGVLEEIISYVHSNSSLAQSQSGDHFRTSFIQQTSSSSAGFVKARILEENWNGFEMRIKAEVTADPVAIRKELERTLALKQNTQPQDLQAQPVQSKPVSNQPVMSAPAAVSTLQQSQLPPIMPVANTTPDYTSYLRTAQLSQVYALLQPVKITMTEYYMMHGKWPSRLEDIKLKPEEMTDGQYLEKVRLGDNGQILAYLSDTFGKDKRLSLTPKSIMGGMQTRWDCTTNLNTNKLHGLINSNCSEDKNL